MLTEEGSEDYCAQCKEYLKLFDGYMHGLIKADFNSWQGLGYTIKEIVKDIHDKDKVTVKALGSDCRECDDSCLRMYSDVEYLESMKEIWERLNEELNEELDYEDRGAFTMRKTAGIFLDEINRLLDRHIWGIKQHKNK